MPLASYAWLITKDHLFDQFPKSEIHRAGMAGPANAPLEFLRMLQEGKGRTFRMYDDDGELYYTGRIITRDDGGYNSEDSMAPLDDFGEPDAGCTEIKYWVSGEWKAV